MTDADRTAIFQTLSGRHDELLAELDALEKQIEIALAATRPPSADVAPSLSASAA
jgi:hypothetical protein